MNILVVSESFVIRDYIGRLFTDIFQTTDIKVVSNLNGLDDVYLFNLDLAFIDVNKNSVGIIESLANIKLILRKFKIMILDFNRDKEIFLNLIKLSVDGYLINICDNDEFIYIVKRVMNGKKFYDSELLQYVINQPINNNIQMLTNRELDVLKQVSRGLSNKDISDNLVVTDHTIKKHVSNILRKLGLRNRQDIVIYAKDNELF